MKRWLSLLGLVLVAGAAGFGVARWLAASDVPANSRDWLAEEFTLNAEQMQRIAQLRAAYEPICMAHCEAIQNAQYALETAQDDADATTARQDLRRWQTQCSQSTQEHLAAIAKVMGPEKGTRFLALVLPRLAQHNHAEPLSLP